MVEMGLFTIVLVPMPARFRQAVFKWIGESKLAAKAQRVLRILNVFIFILFLDSFNRAFKAESTDHLREPLGAAMPLNDTLQNSKIFRAQRNMYLTGFTLFLSLILNRFVGMIMHMTKVEQQLAALKGQGQVAEGSARDAEALEEKVAKLEEELKDARTEAKKGYAAIAQAKNLSKEYDTLSEKYSALERKLDSYEGGIDSKKDV
jgi:hypothetical protein